MLIKHVKCQYITTNPIDIPINSNINLFRSTGSTLTPARLQFETNTYFISTAGASQRRLCTFITTFMYSPVELKVA
jgi:hypothetical protein